MSIYLCGNCGHPNEGKWTVCTECGYDPREKLKQMEGEPHEHLPTVRLGQTLLRDGKPICAYCREVIDSPTGTRP